MYNAALLFTNVCSKGLQINRYVVIIAKERRARKVVTKLLEKHSDDDVLNYVSASLLDIKTY